MTVDSAPPPPNSPPNKPTVEPDIGTVNEPVHFKIKSTDSDDDELWYRIDWDYNGTNMAPNLFVPGGIDSYVVSGTGVPQGTLVVPFPENTWIGEGIYTIGVTATDSFGQISDVAVHNIDIQAASAPSSDISIGSDNHNVWSGEEVTITWSANNVISCNVAGPGVSVTYDPAPGNMANGSRTVVITADSTFTIECNPLDGSPPTGDSVTVRLKTIPNFEEI